VLRTAIVEEEVRAAEFMRDAILAQSLASVSILVVCPTGFESGKRPANVNTSGMARRGS
jgi:hypothetical protein